MKTRRGMMSCFEMAEEFEEPVRIYYMSVRQARVNIRIAEALVKRARGPQWRRYAQKLLDEACAALREALKGKDNETV